MTQYYTTMQVWIQNEDYYSIEVSPVGHKQIQQKIDALNPAWLKFWNEKLDNKVEALNVKLSDNNEFLYILVNTKDELADDTYNSMVQSIFYTTGFDTYDDNAVPLLKAIKDVTGGNISTQWDAGIYLLDTEFANNFANDLSGNDKSWFNAELAVAKK